ncbi:MAG: DNA/RNA nuclease SfsA [Pseudomonadota bacterium]
MRLPQPLHKGRLLKRYNRFLADIAFEDGQTATVHCPNPGSMMSVAVPDAPVWASISDNPKRKLKHTWELIEIDGALVGINTNNPNKIGEEGIAAGVIEELAGYDSLRREVKYGVEKSRIDILLEDAAKPPCYVEIKNVHLMREKGLAEFPDSVTSRGAKHLRELAKIVANGGRAVMLYIVQRPDCKAFALAEDLDPGYAAALKEAKAAGVETLCYDCDITVEAITLRKALPFAA